MIDQIISLLYSALFFITPLIMTRSTSELFEFNKMLFIYASTVLIAFFWFLKMISFKKIILKKTFLDIPIVIFFLSQLISTVISLDTHTSIFGYYGRFNGGLLSIVCYVILYYALVSNTVNIEKLLKAIIASSLFTIIWAIPGHFGYDLTCLLFAGQLNNSCWDNTTLAFRPELRAFSTLGQPNWLGAYLAVAFFIGIYYLIRSFIIPSSSRNLDKDNDKILRLSSFAQDDKKSFLYVLYLLVNFSMILFTRSRSALMAVFVGLILFVTYYSLFIKTNLKKVLIILLIVILVPILFFKTGEDKVDKYLDLKNLSSIIYPQKTTINPPSSVVQSNVTESFDIRKIVWEGAWQLALKYPLFGTGVETFAYSYYLVRPITHNLTSEWDFVYNKAHNEYFNFLATTGFIGLGAYLLMIVFVIGYGVKNYKKSLISLLIISYITILITNFFGFSTTTVQLFFYLIPAFIIGSNNSLPPNTNNLSIIQKILVFLLLTSTIYLLFSITVYYLADVNYSYGLKYSKVNDQQKAAQYFEKALKLRQEPVYIDKFSSSLAYLSAIASMQNQVELAKQIASISDSYNRKIIHDNPKNVFYWKTRAKNMYYFYQITDKENELLQGFEALKNAKELSPTDPKIPYSIALYSSMLFDLSKNNSDKQKWQKLSLEEINKVTELKSNYREGYLLKGQLLKKYGLTEEAKKVFEYMLKNFDKNDAEVLKELR